MQTLSICDGWWFVFQACSELVKEYFCEVIYHQEKTAASKIKQLFSKPNFYQGWTKAVKSDNAQSVWKVWWLGVFHKHVPSAWGGGEKKWLCVAEVKPTTQFQRFHPYAFSGLADGWNIWSLDYKFKHQMLFWNNSKEKMWHKGFERTLKLLLTAKVLTDHR